MFRGNAKMRAVGIIMLVNSAAAMGYVIYLYCHLGAQSSEKFSGYLYQILLVFGFEVYKIISGFVAFRKAEDTEESLAVRNNGIIMTGLSIVWVYLAIRNHTGGLGAVGGSFSEFFMIATALVDLLCSQLLILSAAGSEEDIYDDGREADTRNYICPKFVVKN